MKRIFLILSVLSILGLIATFPIKSSFHSKARLIQRVQKTASGDLFGDEGTPIGAPTLSIIEDEKAYSEPADATGLYKVDEGYLTEHKIHPLQLKTVDFLVASFQIGFAGAGLLFGLISWRLKSKNPIALDAP